MDTLHFDETICGGAFLGVEYEGQALEPFKQGKLDRFCGIYALINAVQLASRGIVTSEQSTDRLFETLITMSMETHKKNKYRYRGLSGPELKRLADTLLYGLNINDYRLNLYNPWRHLLKDGERHLSKRKLIKRATKLEQSALIVHVDNELMSHWTVAQSISGTRVTLFDSDDLQSVSVKHVTPWKLIVDRSKHL